MRARAAPRAVSRLFQRCRRHAQTQYAACLLSRGITRNARHARPVYAVGRARRHMRVVLKKNMRRCVRRRYVTVAAAATSRPFLRLARFSFFRRAAMSRPSSFFAFLRRYRVGGRCGGRVVRPGVNRCSKGKNARGSVRPPVPRHSAHARIRHASLAGVPRLHVGKRRTNHVE